MQTTTISLPENLAQEVEKQIKQSSFASRSEFFRAAVKTYLSLQKGELSWEILAAPFRIYAKNTGLSEKDVLKAVEKTRHAQASKSSQ